MWKELPDANAIHAYICKYILEPLQDKNRQSKTITFRLMKDQPVTNVIQLFPPVSLLDEGKQMIAQ